MEMEDSWMENPENLKDIGSGESGKKNTGKESVTETVMLAPGKDGAEA